MFDVPADTILPLEHANLAVDPAPHPFERANIERIEAHWQAARAANPALFDGKVALLSRLVYRGGRLEGRCHMVRYASFLLWRRLRPLNEAQHIYAHAVPVAGDGALLAIRMASQTVNAGLIYFAAGSFDPDDIREEQIDIAHNMRREVGEETGIDLAEARAEPRLYALWRPEGTVIFRRHFFREPSGVLAARIVEHVRRSAGSEIDGPVIIGSAGERPERLAAQMPTLINWHFSQPEERGG